MVMVAEVANFLLFVVVWQLISTLPQVDIRAIQKKRFQVHILLLFIVSNVQLL